MLLTLSLPRLRFLCLCGEFLLKFVNDCGRGSTDVAQRGLRGRSQTRLLRRSRMFIDTEGNPKTKAPEERNVVRDDSNQQHAAPPELRKLYGAR